MAYVRTDGPKKQSQMCLLPAAGGILTQRIPRYGSCARWSVPSTPQLAVIRWIVQSKGAAGGA